VFCQSRLNLADPAAAYYIDVQATTDGGSESIADVLLNPGTPVVGPIQLQSGDLVIERGGSKVDARLDFVGQALDSQSTCAMTITEGGPTAPVALVSSSALQASAGGDACGECLTASCSGPLADEALRCTGTTCDAYKACLESSGCGSPDVRACYCGSVDPAVCFDVFSDPSVPQGPCKTQTEQLTGLTNPLQIGTRYFDPTFPIGAVNQLVLCTNNNCSGECG
jgi:hypothetical protein